MKFPCPSCKNNTQSVKAVTLRSLLSDTARTAAGDFQGFRFCSDLSCEILYFQPERRLELGRDAVTMEVFQKSTLPERLVCYCFGHSVAEVEAEVMETGTSRAIASISEKCRAGEDHCQERNPQGRCCLGNVRSVVRLAQDNYGIAVSSATKSNSCCEESEPNRAGNSCCAASDEEGD